MGLEKRWISPISPSIIPPFIYPIPGMRIYSDSKVSDFLNSITVDQRISFLNEWNRHRDHRETIYISYDSTNKTCHAGDIDLVELGHAKEGIETDIFNYSMAYDRNNREPLFYEAYPGSIVDISQLQFTLKKAKSYGYEHVGFILDRGYFCKENISFILNYSRSHQNDRLLSLD